MGLKGIVERLIGTLMQLVHQIPGTTFSNIAERGDYPSEQKAILTMAELEKWLTIAITEYYHQKIHSGISMPPIEKFKIGILGDEIHKGCGYFPKIENKTEGVLGEIFTLLRRAAILAIETEYECIDESILKEMDYHSPAERIKLFEQSIVS